MDFYLNWKIIQHKNTKWILIYCAKNSDLKSSIIYITAFNDRNVFRKFAKEIAWETEVWIADNPSHMIHFNGDKFLGPHLGA